MLPPLFSLWGLVSFHYGVLVSVYCWLPLMNFGSPPLTPHFLCTLLRFPMVGIPFPSSTVSVEPSKLFAKYLSILVRSVLSGNASVSNFTTSSLFHIRKSTGRGHSSRSSQLLGLVLPTSTSFGLHPVAQLQLHPLPQLAPYCLFGWNPTAPSRLPGSHISAALSPVVDLQSLYKNTPRLCPSSWPLLMLFWHGHRGPLTRVPSVHLPILPLGTALSPGTAPVYRSILSLPSFG